MASSEIVTPHPLTARRVCIPLAFGTGVGHTRRVERGVGGGGSIVRSSEDARHCSVLYICKYFVEIPINQQYFSVSEQKLDIIRQL
jgi:hypothetical protein